MGSISETRPYIPIVYVPLVWNLPPHVYWREEVVVHVVRAQRRDWGLCSDAASTPEQTAGDSQKRDRTGLDPAKDIFLSSRHHPKFQGRIIALPKCYNKVGGLPLDAFFRKSEKNYHWGVRPFWLDQKTSVVVDSVQDSYSWQNSEQIYDWVAWMDILTMLDENLSAHISNYDRDLRIWDSKDMHINVPPCGLQPSLALPEALEVLLEKSWPRVD